MTDLHHHTLTQLSQMLAQRQTSASELAQHFLQRSQAHAHLGAYLSIDEEATLAQAQAADERIANGSAGKLTGVPIAHKDIFVTREWPTTAASRRAKRSAPPT